MTALKYSLSVFIVSILLGALMNVSAQGTQGVCTGFTTRLSANGIAQVTPGVANRLRNNAGTSAGQIGTIPVGATMTVLEGPRCANGYTWWRVNYNGQVGWTAEGQANTYYLAPAAPTSGSPQQPVRRDSPDDDLQGVSAASAAIGSNDCLRALLQNGLDVTFALYDEITYSTGATVILSPYAYDDVGICLSSEPDIPTDQIYAVAPDGSVIPSVIVEEGNPNGLLEVYNNLAVVDVDQIWCRQGIWTIYVGGFVLYIDVQDAFSLLNTPAAMPPCYGITLAGYAPNEPVALMFAQLEQTLGFDYTYQYYDITADGNGTVTYSGLPDYLVAAIGESGSTYIEPNYGARFKCLSKERILYDLLWQAIPFNLSDWLCHENSAIFVGPGSGYNDLPVFMGTEDYFVPEGESITLTYAGQAGEGVRIYTSADWDTTLSLRDVNGIEIASNDDGFNGRLISLIEYNLPTTQVYQIVIGSFNNSSGGTVDLVIEPLSSPSTQPVAPVAAIDLNLLELSTDVQLQFIPGLVFIPAAYGENYGEVVAGGVNRWSFGGVVGQTLTLYTVADWDTTLTLRDPNGTQIAVNDDMASTTLSSYIQVVLPIDGTYEIIVGSYNDQSGGAYTLVIQ